ncbi:hypothetical protein RJ639_034560 [Escallonia herrerae]|uniref:CCHC-type domain-containing protein n=1 Tax=Escallonia herrerae TaxID=1293975 RepID=A0AA88WTB0_9ASTE|nr:hypothetical protein RJ639_034560 [Escallonia herrerae]
MQPHNHQEINDLIAQTDRLKCSLEPLSLESDPDVPNPSTPSILVGKIINDKPLNRTGVKNTILKAWNPPSGLKIREQDDHLLFTFNNSQDLQRILDRRPWSIMGTHLTLQPWPPDKSLQEVFLNKSPFWVIIYGLPPNKMTRKNAAIIGDIIGSLLEIEESMLGRIGEKGFMSLKIDIDIEKAFLKGFVLKREGDKDSWIQFRYEKLPNFCFGCGHLGHVQKWCFQSKDPSASWEIAGEQRPYNPSICAEYEGFWNHTPISQFQNWKPRTIEPPSSSTGEISPPMKRNQKNSAFSNLDPYPETICRATRTCNSNSLLTTSFLHPTTIPSATLSPLPSKPHLPEQPFLVLSQNKADPPVGAHPSLVNTNHLSSLVMSSPVKPISCVDQPICDLCLAWKLGVDLEIVSASANLISGLVFSDPTDTPWMLTAIYGPWLGIGDFNEILAISDKRGGRPYASPSHGGFPSVMLEKGLVDLGFSGNPFTWMNKRPLLANIRERLDRGLGNPQWRILFPNVTIKHLLAILSDHNPICLKTTGYQSGPKPFKFLSC